MGEYADDYFRREVMSRHGFDPGSMYGDSKPKPKPGKNAEYKKLLRLAQAKGWVVPNNEGFPKTAWVAYWQACKESERNPDGGRPVPPHR